MFEDLVRRHLFDDAHLHDDDVARYVSELLEAFAHVDRLYGIRDQFGRPLEAVADMLIESNPLLGASSFDRERAVRKHVGDFTLFFTGLFPEAVAALPRLNPLSTDAFVDYVAAGKESYAIVAAFNLCEYRAEAPLFRKLSDGFEQCVLGLNLVKRDLRGL